MEDRLDLRSKSRRSNRWGENSQTSAFAFVLSFQRRIERRKKCAPRTDFPSFYNRLRAVGIIEVQNRRLMKSARRAETGRMLWIPFNFSRSAFMTFHEQARSIAVQLHCRGKIQRFAGNDFFGSLDIR